MGMIAVVNWTSVDFQVEEKSPHPPALHFSFLCQMFSTVTWNIEYMVGFNNGSQTQTHFENSYRVVQTVQKSKSQTWEH